MAHGITKKGEKLVCPIDDNGRFTEEVPDFVGVQARLRPPLTSPLPRPELALSSPGSPLTSA